MINVIKKLLLTCIAMVFICPIAGCFKNEPKSTDAYQTMPGNPTRNTEAAKGHNKAALNLIKQDLLESAERELKLAIEADLLFGPAHNNLGSVYYRQKRFYLAAWEFQYAANLMPKQTQPRNNLGLVYESVGRLQDAEKQYDKALKINPEDVDVIGNLARVHIRSNRKDKKTQELLSKIVMSDERSNWVSWAKRHLALMDVKQSTPKPTHDPTAGVPLSELIE